MICCEVQNCGPLHSTYILQKEFSKQVLTRSSNLIRSGQAGVVEYMPTNTHPIKTMRSQPVYWDVYSKSGHTCVIPRIDCQAFPIISKNTQKHHRRDQMLAAQLSHASHPGRCTQAARWLPWEAQRTLPVIDLETSPKALEKNMRQLAEFFWLLTRLDFSRSDWHDERDQTSIEQPLTRTAAKREQEWAREWGPQRQKRMRLRTTMRIKIIRIRRTVGQWYWKNTAKWEPQRVKSVSNQRGTQRWKVLSWDSLLSILAVACHLILFSHTCTFKVEVGSKRTWVCLSYHNPAPL